MDHEKAKIQGLLTKLKRAKRYPFPRSGKRLVPSDEKRVHMKGVYVIYGPGGKVLHVGSTPRAKGGMAQRLRDHLANRSSFTMNYLAGRGSKLRRKGYEFQCLGVDKGRDRALLEALGIGQLCPKHIGHGLDSSVS